MTHMIASPQFAAAYENEIARLAQQGVGWAVLHFIARNAAIDMFAWSRRK